MLKLLHKKEYAKKIVFSILILGSILAFMFWGAGASRISSKTTGFAGEIFGRKVPMHKFLAARSAYLNTIRLRLGEDYNKILPFININGQTWMQLILAEEAKRLKISVSDQEVIEEITNTPLFWRDGKFNQQSYNRITHYFLNVQPRQFEEQTRMNLVIRKLFEKITKDINVSGDEVFEAYKREFQALSINYIVVKPEDLLKHLTVTEDEVKTYYQNNAKEFKKPASANIEYIGIDYRSRAKDADKLKILKQVESLRSRLKADTDLKTLVREPFVHRESGFFAANEPIKEIGYNLEFHKFAFSLKEKEFSPAIQTSKGVYILRVIQKKEPLTADFEEVKEKAKDAFLKQKADQEAKNKIEGYKTKIAKYLADNPEADIKKIAQELGAEIKTTPLLKQGENIPDIGLDEKISEAAFSLKPNQISDCLRGPSGYYLIWQEKFVDIDAAKFKAEKETFRKKLLQAKRTAYFNDFTANLIAKSNLKDYSTK